MAVPGKLCSLINMLSGPSSDQYDHSWKPPVLASSSTLHLLHDREPDAEEAPSTPLVKVTLPAPGVFRLPGGKSKQRTPVTWQSAKRRAAQQAGEPAGNTGPP